MEWPTTVSSTLSASDQPLSDDCSSSPMSPLAREALTESALTLTMTGHPAASMFLNMRLVHPWSVQTPSMPIRPYTVPPRPADLQL